MTLPFDYRLDVQGTATYVRERAGDGPAVLLLPGGALDTVELTWSGVLDGLPATYRLLLPDLPGYGFSAPLPASTTDAYVRWLGGVVEATGLERFVLAGSSKGGAVALAYALAHPERLAGLVLSAPYGILPRVPLHPLVSRLVRWRGAVPLARRLLRRPGVLALFFRLVALKRWDALTPDLLHDAYAGIAPPQALDAFGAWLRDELRPEGCRTYLTPRFPALATPVLWLHGDADRTLPLAAARAAAARLPDVAFCEMDAGHLPPREQANATLAAVQAFVERVR